MGKKVSALEKATDRAGKAMKAWLSIQAVQKLDQWAEHSFKLQTVMNNLPISIDKARSSTMGLTNDYELATAAAKAVRLGVVQNSEQFAQLAEAATKLGLSVGQDAGKSVEDLTTALGRASPMILDNLGITLKLSDAYDRYATSLGKSAKDLTEAEKAEAFKTEGLKAALEAAKDVTVEVDEGTKAWREYKVELQNLANDVLPIVGKGLGVVIGKLNELLGIKERKGKDDLVDALVNIDIASRGAEDAIAAQMHSTKNLEAIMSDTAALKSTKREQLSLIEAYNQGRIDVESYTESLRHLSDRFDHIAGASGRRAQEKVQEVNDFLAKTAAMFAETGTTAESVKAKPKRRGGGKRGPQKSLLEQSLMDFKPQDGGEFSGAALVADLDSARTAKKIEAIDREIEAERRRLEVQETLHGQSLELIRQREEAELAAIEKRRELAWEEEDRKMLDSEADQVRHEAHLARIEQRQEMEQRAHEDEMRRAKEREKTRGEVHKKIAMFQSIEASGASVFATVLSSVAASTEGSEERKKRAMARASGTIAVINAVLEGARAAAAFARYDFGAGAAHIAAAAAFTAASVMAFREAGGGGAGAGANPGLAAANIAPPEASGGSRGGRRDPVVPTSIPSQGQQGQAAGGQFGQSGGRVININIGEMRTMTASDREEEGKRLGELIRASDRSLGAA